MSRHRMKPSAAEEASFDIIASYKRILQKDEEVRMPWQLIRRINLRPDIHANRCNSKPDRAHRTISRYGADKH
jgi:hypothetical protein